MDNIVCVSQIAQFRRCIFSQNINIFRHLELEIALASGATVIVLVRFVKSKMGERAFYREEYVNNSKWL